MSLLEHFQTILISSLSNIFSVAESTNNYKVLTTVANEIDIANTSLDDLRKSISLNQAVSGDLDLFGFQMNLQRVNNEEDESYRQRLLSSYDREYITKNNLEKLSSDYSVSYPKIEESIYDRWWLGGSPLPDKQIEQLTSTTGTVVHASSGVLSRTIPDCFLITDLTKTGTNYCSGCSFTNTSSGATITLTTHVSAGTKLSVSYTPNQIISGENVDWVPLSFISNDMIIKHRNMSNNYAPIETTATYIKIQTNMLPGYKAYTMYTDNDKGIVYSWESIVDDNKTITLQESNRTDSLITNEFAISNDNASVTISYDITKVVGVFLSSDITQTGINYATDNNFNGRTIILNTQLPQKIGVIATYNKNAIKNYTSLSNSLFTKTGLDDLRFTIEVQVTQPFLKYGTFKYGTTRWGQLANELTGTLGQLIDTAKAAGIKTSVVLVTKGTFYGADDAIYAQVWYGGSYY